MTSITEWAERRARHLADKHRNRIAWKYSNDRRRDLPDGRVGLMPKDARTTVCHINWELYRKVVAVRTVQRYHALVEQALL